MAWRIYDKATTALLAVAGIVMFGLAIGNAALRYFFDSPLIWGEEISRYAMVWGTMLGIAIAYRGGQHVAVTLLVDTMPRPALVACRLVSHVLALATAFVIWRAGYVLLTVLGFMAAPSSEVPLAWVYAAMPVAGAMLALEAVRLLVADLRALARPA